MPNPILPPYTCPLIDKVQGAIDRAYKIADDTLSTDPAVLTQALRDIRNELRGESDRLERIREANLGLRNCAEHWEAKAEALAETE